MKKYFLLISALPLLFLISCDDSYNISFEDEFPKRNKDIRWKLGDKFMIKNGADTTTYFVRYDAETKHNYIISEQKDTVFKGHISKYRGLYYFSYPIDDTSYWIYAVDIKSGLFNEVNKIKAWDKMYEQILILENELKNNKYQNLISKKDTTNKHFRLKADVDILSKYFTSVMDSFAYDTLILEIDLIKDEVFKEISSGIDTLKNEIEDIVNTDEKLISAIIPNPFSHEFELKMKYDSEYEYEIYNSESKLVKSGSFTGNSENVLTVALKPDTYVIMVKDVENLDVESIKAVKVQAM
jgi:hypothetical protein